MQLSERMVVFRRRSNDTRAAALVGTSGNFRAAGKKPAMGPFAGGGFILVPGRSVLAAFCAYDIRAGAVRAALVEEEQNIWPGAMRELRL